MSKKMYRRLCTTLNDKGKLIPSTANVYDYVKDQKKDYYLGLYLYNEDQKKKFYSKVEKVNKKTGEVEETINGAKGINDVVTDKLVFDFDSKTNLEQAKSDTIELVDRLKTKGIDPEKLCITFSGNKGFGVEVLTNQEFTPEEAKSIAIGIAGDLDTFDPVIFNASRIIRVPFTRHQESNLCKLPLEYDELKETPLDEILTMAKDLYEPEVVGSTVTIPSSLLKLKEVKKKEVRQVSAEDAADLDLYNKPKWLSNWKYAIQEGFFPEGIRNHSLMILAATYRGQGFNKITAYRMLKGAAELQSQRTGQERYSDEEIWMNIIEQVYDSGWNGGTYAEDNFPENLKEYLTDIGIPRSNEKEEEFFVKANDVFDTFENFAENIEKNTIKTGIEELDRLCRITTSMLVGVLGAPGAGKTATILNILESHSGGGEESILFSLDMGKPLIYQKLAQKKTGLPAEEIFKIFVNKNEKKKQEIKHSIDKSYANMQMCFKTGATVDDIKKYIMAYEQQTGKKVRLIVVDYLEKLVGPFSDATANSGYNAAKLQEVCNELELCCLLLLQPQKMAGDPSEPLLTYRRVKGASVIEQDCRVIFSVFREGYHPQSYDEDNFITYAVLKNTMGTLGSVDCYWTGRTGSVDPIDDDGRAELKKLRKRKADKKALEDL
jgi:replicative DNA helicase